MPGLGGNARAGFWEEKADVETAASAVQLSEARHSNPCFGLARDSQLSPTPH